jgi:hypothetical protein
MFSHKVPKLVQALVKTYDEIFQALAVEGDILLPNPFLDLAFDGVVRCKSPTSEIFSVYQARKTARRPSRGCAAVAEVQKWLRQQDVSFYLQGLENLIVGFDKCLNMFGDYDYRTDVQTYPCAFLVSAYLHSPKKQ